MTPQIAFALVVFSLGMIMWVLVHRAINKWAPCTTCGSFRSRTVSGSVAGQNIVRMRRNGHYFKIEEEKSVHLV